MARLISNGAELQSAANLMEATTVGSNVSISTSIKRSGAASWRVQPTASSSGFLNRFYASTNDAVSTYYARAYIYIATLPTVTGSGTGNNDVSVMVFQNNASTVYCELTIDASGTLRLYSDSGTPALIGTYSTPLSTNKWYRLEISYVATGGNVSARVDGNIFASATGVSGLGGVNFLGVGVGLIGGDVATADIYYDDIAINDNTGTIQNSWPGDGKIVHLLPNAAGDNNTWESSAGAAGTTSNYTSVNEITPDDGTSYLKRITTTIKVDDYNVTNSATAGINPGDFITLVQVGVRGGSTNTTASTDRDILLRIKSASGGTVSKSASSTNRFNTASGSWATNTAVIPGTYKLTAYTDPTTGVAWTPTGTNSIDNMQIGMENQTSVTTEVRVSAIWAVVEYVPAIIPSMLMTYSPPFLT